MWNCGEEVVGQRLAAGVGRSRMVGVEGHETNVWNFVKDLGSQVTSLESWWVGRQGGHGKVEEAGGRLVCVVGWDGL